jgi:large subunit ribosomal protein L35
MTHTLRSALRVRLYFRRSDRFMGGPQWPVRGANEAGQFMATKNKTNRSLKKRFRITASGKLKHNSPGKRHLLSGRKSKRKRQLRAPAITNDKTAKKYVEAMGGA